MINITDKRNCCSCTACKSICPTHAIEMRADALGFAYPFVNKDKCTECGLCEKVCAFTPNYDKSENLDLPDVYAVRHKEIEQIKTSRSGAAFIAFSDYILEQGGLVYGAGYDKDLRVIHKKATTKTERDEFKGSKYVQSDINNCFKEIRQELKRGKKVVFSGTACQVAGLKSYIGKNLRENLYLMDIICHGVPGPYLLRDYLVYNQKKYKKTITGIEFRDKLEAGWWTQVERLDFGQKHIHSILYRRIFHSHYSLARACEVCHFANTIRPGDVTLGDFWGYKRVINDFVPDRLGCSLILCNTPKAQSWFEEIKPQVNYIKVKLEDALQANLQRPTPKSPRREEFEKDYAAYGFDFIKKKYYKTKLTTKIKDFLSKNFVKPIKKKFKK